MWKGKKMICCALCASVSERCLRHDTILYFVGISSYSFLSSSLHSGLSLLPLPESRVDFGCVDFQLSLYFVSFHEILFRFTRKTRNFMRGSNAFFLVTRLIVIDRAYECANVWLSGDWTSKNFVNEEFTWGHDSPKNTRRSHVRAPFGRGTSLSYRSANRAKIPLYDNSIRWTIRVGIRRMQSTNIFGSGAKLKTCFPLKHRASFSPYASALPR